MTVFRAICFFILLFASVFVSPWLLIPAAVLYAFWWHAYELLFAAAFVDAYLGVGLSLPYYTIAAFLIVVTLEWLKPSLSFYTERTRS